MGERADKCRDALLRQAQECDMDSGFSIAWVVLEPEGALSK